MDKVYTQDHFSNNIPVWDQVLGPLKGAKGLRALEIGSLEGRSAVWLLENVLTDPDSRLVCVDPHQDFLGIKGSTLFLRFLSNIATRVDQVDIVRNRSQDALLAMQGGSFDFIYVDGDHTAPSVLTDSILAWRLLKPGGIIIFDDYGAENDGVRPAVTAFASCFEHLFQVVHVGWQVVLRRRVEGEADEGPEAAEASEGTEAKKECEEAEVEDITPISHS